ncbi:VanZ family protein [Craterilacuibacter sp.]|uniref:VanZ family protein n=1 Tax=Craterilacuibacter sp. TaxID=2870909 RepID=UPI003F2B2505
MANAQRSHVAQYTALITFVVIVFSSFYPFTDWVYSGQPLLEFVSYPLPYYFRLFDNAVNFLIYLPLGFALALTCRHRLWGWLLAVVLSVLVSFLVEFGQQFLPMRVSSNLDMLYNMAGAVLGATLAVSPGFRRVWHSVWQRRQRYFRHESMADYAVVLIVVWFVTQLDPSIPLFGVVVRPIGLPQPFISPMANPMLFLLLVEAGGVMLNLTAFLLFITTFLASRRYTARAITIALVLAWFLKVLAAGTLLKPMAFFEWINQYVMTGLSAGFLLVWLVTRFGQKLQAVVALLALLGTQALVALWPLARSDADMLSLFRWHYGHLANMNALVAFLSQLWPYAACVVLAGLLWQSAGSKQPQA